MTGKQLKNSILQWAIQGKLVPQDPNDEPASVLLEKIRAEKARLIKEGKIKKDKKESIIYRGDDNSYYEKFADGKVVCIDDEIPFEIANGWEWSRFSSIYWQLTDGTHSTPKYTQSGIPFLSVKDMSTGRLSFANTKFISKEEHKLLSQRCHPCKGDLLLSKVGTTGIPLIIDDDREFCIFVSLALVKFFPKFIDSSFLIALLNSPLVQMQVKENTRGVGNKNWVLTAISNTLLAIPPLREQQRIVDKISILNPYTESYARSESKISHLNKDIGKNLKKSILQEAIQGKLVPQAPTDEPASILLQRIRDEKQRLVKEGKLKKKDIIDTTIFRGNDNKYYEQIGKNIIDITDDIPFEIPNNWVWTRIGYLFAHNNGKQLNKGNSVGTLMEYITTSNLYWGGFRLDNLKRMPFEESEIERCQAIKGDLLVCEGGDVGRSCIWTNDNPIMLQNHIHKLRAYKPLCTKYFYYIFYIYNLMGLIGGKGIGIQGFSAKALHNTIIPLPPQKEQERIVKKIETVFDRIKGD